MPSKHDAGHAPFTPHLQPSELESVRRGLRTSLGMGLAIALLASLGGSTIASDTPGQVLVTDSFARSDTGTWGTTDSGQRWRFPKASVGIASVADGGLMTLPAPGSRQSALLEGKGTSVRDMTMKFSFSLDRMPGRGSATILATARKSAAGAYRALIRVAPRGGLWLSFSKQRQGSSGTLVMASPSGAVTCLRQPGHLASRQILGFAAPPRDGSAFLGSPRRMTPAS